MSTARPCWDPLNCPVSSVHGSGLGRIARWGHLGRGQQQQEQEQEHQRIISTVTCRLDVSSYSAKIPPPRSQETEDTTDMGPGRYLEQPTSLAPRCIGLKKPNNLHTFECSSERARLEYLHASTHPPPSVVHIPRHVLASCRLQERVQDWGFLRHISTTSKTLNVSIQYSLQQATNASYSCGAIVTLTSFRTTRNPHPHHTHLQHAMATGELKHRLLPRPQLGAFSSSGPLHVCGGDRSRGNGNGNGGGGGGDPGVSVPSQTAAAAVALVIGSGLVFAVTPVSRRAPPRGRGSRSEQVRSSKGEG